MVRVIRKSASPVFGFALCLALWTLVACRRSPTGGVPAASVVASSPSPPEQNQAAVAGRLCAGRAGCSVRQRRPLLERGELVDLAVTRASNPEQCDGAEYWLLRAGTATFLATDCDAQDGADTRAHANVRVDSEFVVVDYEEGLSSDLCAGSGVRVSQRDFRVVDERRWSGERKAGKCTQVAERTVDWHFAKHVARWSSRACAGRAGAGAHTGDAIPVYEVTGVSAQTALGSCAATVGRAAQSKTTAAGDSAIQMRAAVVNAALTVEISGVTRGALSVIVTGNSPDDDVLGVVGCGTEAEHGLSTATIDLESGHVTAHGSYAPKLEISAREGSSLRLYAPALGGVERIALSYRGPNGEHLDSAQLSSRPTVSELPPLDIWFQSKEPCELRAGRVETRAALGPQPLLRLGGW